MPSLQNLKDRYRDESFKVLLVNVREQRSEVAHLFKKAGVDLQVVLDREGAVSRDYHVSNHPIKFLVDRQGHMMAIGYGYRDWDSEELNRLLQILIHNSSEQPGS